MSTDSSDAADDPAAQSETEVDIEAEHRQAQESGEVFEGEHPDSR
jgi:hypothetical protein